MITLVESAKQRDALLNMMFGHTEIIECSDERTLYASVSDNDKRFAIYENDQHAEIYPTEDLMMHDMYDVLSIYIRKNSLADGEKLVKDALTVKIDGNIRYGDIRQVERIIERNTFDKEAFWKSIKNAACFYTESQNPWNVTILSCEATVDYHAGVCGLSDDFTHEPNCGIDIYVNLTVYAENSKSGRIGYYMSDFCDIQDGNESLVKQIKAKAFRSWDSFERR